jgi:hypothetical protein
MTPLLALADADLAQLIALHSSSVLWLRWPLARPLS